MALLAAALAGAAAASIAPAANAATKDVWAGPPNAKAPSGLPQQGDANEFFPKTVTIAAGDKLSWRSATFHTVTLPVLDEYPPAFAGIDAASPVENAVDAAGNPFFFNGAPGLRVTPAIIAPTAGKTYDGTALGNSAVLIGPRSARYDLKFTQPGTFAYYCVIHPGMKATVTVKPKGAKYPSAASDKRRVRRQVGAWVADNKRDARVKPPAGMVLAGNDHGLHVLQRFFPAHADVRVGQPLTFKLTRGTSEAHTLTFGPRRYLDDLAAEYVHAGGALDPIANYPSDAVLPPVDGANHGNGFVNSGLLDEDPATPLGDSATFTFAKPGSYSYVCLLHPGRAGTVVVH
jgi:plastocyanin